MVSVQVLQLFIITTVVKTYLTQGEHSEVV